jgi:hypothetical protein
LHASSEYDVNGRVINRNLFLLCLALVANGFHVNCYLGFAFQKVGYCTFGHQGIAVYGLLGNLLFQHHIFNVAAVVIHISR